MKNYYYPLLMTGSAVMVLAAQPSYAASIQVTDIQLLQNQNRLELKLSTLGSSATRSQIITVSRGKDLVADIPNSELQLNGRGNFLKENPLPGIRSVEVSQLNPNSIRVIVRGENLAPTGKVLQQENKSITLSFTPSKQKPTNLANIKPSTQPSVVAQNQPTQTQPTEPLFPSQSEKVLFPNPPIIIEDNSIPSTTNGVESPTPAPTFIPRAVAPPVGDMAVANIDTTPDSINLGTNVLVPRLVLRQAPVREVLSLLARSASYNVVFLDEGGNGAPQGGQPTPTAAGSTTVSLDLENQPVQEVFNSVLSISGLNASLKGRTIFISSKLPDAARNLISRTLRLNQVQAANAGTFLAAQGAEFQQLYTPIKDIIDPETQRLLRREPQPPELRPLVLQSEGSTAPLLLKGMKVTTDDRLNSITLIGEPRKVEIATSLLTQLDARRRQVAVNVKVVDINLDNTTSFGSNFSFGINDTGIVNQGGVGVINFGGTDQTTPNITDATGDNVSGGLPAVILGVAPFNVGNEFLLQLRSSIQSGNAKILSDPTLVVQEGQEATVKLVQNVVESVKTEVDGDSGTRTITPIIAEVGLLVSVNIQKIDDNGFIAMSVNPTVSSPGLTQEFDSGEGAVNTINLIQKRALSSGIVRLRDGQTLILSGIIQETERATVSKIPVLGDLPIIGALFRSTSNQNQRQEVVIVVTPQLVDENSRFGYNFTPGNETSDILKKQGFPIQGNPTP